MNRYELLSIIGEGAYGSVYKARKKSTGEINAIKKFKDKMDPNTSKNIKHTILREIQMLKQLQNNQYVVILHDQFKRRGRVHLVFEYIDQSLLDLLEKNPGGLEKPLINHLLLQLLRAIQFCHINNVIHRDVKPENLLVDSKTKVLKLCDFGFARHLQKSDESPVTEYVATRWYRAPELLVGASQHTTAVDVWPVGCIWVEMVSGDPLFPGDSEIDQLYLIQEGVGKPLPSKLKAFFKGNKKYKGLHLPNEDYYTRDSEYTLYRKIQKQQGGNSNYFLEDERIKLLINMLKLDPSERISIDDVIDSIEKKPRKSGKDLVDSRRQKRRKSLGQSVSTHQLPKLKLPKVAANNNLLTELLTSDEDTDSGIQTMPRKSNSKSKFMKKRMPQV